MIYNKPCIHALIVPPNQGGHKAMQPLDPVINYRLFAISDG